MLYAIRLRLLVFFYLHGKVLIDFQWFQKLSKVFIDFYHVSDDFYQRREKRGHAATAATNYRWGCWESIDWHLLWESTFPFLFLQYVFKMCLTHFSERLHFCFVFLIIIRKFVGECPPEAFCRGKTTCPRSLCFFGARIGILPLVY